MWGVLWVATGVATFTRSGSSLTIIVVPRPELTLQAGTKLAAKYTLEKPAGFGGMAQLWVAKNDATGAEICVKVLSTAHGDPDVVERFRREANAAARLTHRNIVRVFDLVELDESGDLSKGKNPRALAIVMELLRGESLGDVLMKKEKLPLDETLDVALPFLSGLANAHRAGVTHRDLKPDNIFLSTDPDGHVIPKILDFGISKASDATPLTHDGEILGTPSFMSPEQARGAKTIDARSDVFSAAIVIYTMLSGKNPFVDESFQSVVTAILERNPAAPEGVPDEIWKVLSRALEKDPTSRFADAGELASALRLAAGRPTMPTPIVVDRLAASFPPVGSHTTVRKTPDAMTPVDPRRTMRRVVFAVVAASCALLFVAGVRSLVGGSGAPPVPVTSNDPPQESVPPPALSAPPPTPSTSASVEPAPVPPEPKATQPRVIAPPLFRSDAAAPERPIRKPGEEPKNARDPGF